MSSLLNHPGHKMKCIETAFSWHGGKSSALYSFASTRQIWSEHHRDDVLDEIDESISWNRLHGEQKPGDISDLQSISRVVIDLPIGAKLPDPYRKR